MFEDAITPDGDSGEDFELARDRGVWLSVRNLSVRVFDSGEGVDVIICKRGQEADDTIAHTAAAWSEGTRCYACGGLDVSEGSELHYHEDDGELYCDSCYIDVVTEDEDAT